MTVHLHLSLRRRAGKAAVRQVELDMPAGSTLADLLGRMEVADHEGILLVINGRTAEPGQVLAEGDEVHLIPAVSGG